MRRVQSEIERRLWNELRCGTDLERGLAAIRLAALLRNRGDLDAAHDLLAAAAGVSDPGVGARAWLALAEFLSETGEASDSLRAYRRVAELADPHLSPDVVIDLGARAEENGNRLGAVALYEAVISADSEPSLVGVAAHRTAMIHRFEGRLGRAIASLRIAYEVSGPDLLPAVELDLAELLLARESGGLWRQEAHELLGSVVAVDHPDLSPRAALCLAREFGAEGSFARAYALLHAVVESRHPRFCGPAEAEISALMHKELESTLRRPASSPFRVETRARMLPEVCLSTEEERAVTPPENEGRDCLWFALQALRDQGRFFAEPACQCSRVPTHERCCEFVGTADPDGLRSFKLRLYSQLCREIDIASRGPVLPKRTPAPASGLLRGLLTRVRDALVGSPPSFSPRLVFEDHGGPSSPGLWIPGAMNLEVSIAFRHSLLLGAQGSADIQELLLAHLGSHCRAGFRLAEPGQLHWCWEDLLPGEDDSSASNREWSSTTQGAHWCISHQTDRLSRLVSPDSRLFDWLADQEGQHHRVEIAVEAALAAEPA